MKKVGFITCEKFADLYYDDKHLIAPFLKAGIEIVPLIWDKTTNYTGLELLVFRSAWDYHFKTTAFEDWLHNLEKMAPPVFNPVPLILQNYDKHYLQELINNDFSIIPTLFFDKVEDIDLSNILKEKNWEKGVIKPVISMSAYHTYAFDEQNVASLQQNLKNYYGETKVMVQKFASEINTEGEWSIIFYDNKYCMAALKTPKKGDFRVQSELGGTIQYLDPPAPIIEQAKAILDYYDMPILYARMDGIIHNNHFQLMEAELIDPELYFRNGTVGQNAFLKAIQDKLK
jgi:hypothetical protein